MKKAAEESPESDRAGDALHPRKTLSLFGHAAAERALLDAYKSGRFPHAWLIGGKAGIGKATLAWRLARFLIAHPRPEDPAALHATSLEISEHAPAAHLISSLATPDLVLLRREWNPKDTGRFYTDIRIDDVRKATSRFHLAASDGGWRIAIIDTGDDLSNSAANALLKMIEEPPSRTVFLIISHQPGRLLPTIRSRCRKLLLDPLHPADIVKAIGPIQGHKPDKIVSAAERAGGSVGEALRLLDLKGSELFHKVDRQLRRLPAISWPDVVALSEQLAPPKARDDFEAFVEIVTRWIDDQVQARAGQGAHRLAPFAQVWEKFGAAARAAEALNLDKRPVVLSVFEDLGAAAAGAAAR